MSVEIIERKLEILNKAIMKKEVEIMMSNIHLTKLEQQRMSLLDRLDTGAVEAPSLESLRMERVRVAVTNTLAPNGPAVRT